VPPGVCARSIGRSTQLLTGATGAGHSGHVWFLGRSWRARLSCAAGPGTSQTTLSRETSLGTSWAWATTVISDSRLKFDRHHGEVSTSHTPSPHCQGHSEAVGWDMPQGNGSQKQRPYHCLPYRLCNQTKALRFSFLRRVGSESYPRLRLSSIRILTTAGS